MTTTLDLRIFDFDPDEMLARAQSFCFDRPRPASQPAHAASEEAAKGEDQGIEPGLMTQIVDALRDYHDAFTAVQLVIRKWRNAKPERMYPGGIREGKPYTPPR